MNKIFYSSLLTLAVTACGGGSGGGGSTAQVKTDVERALESGNALLVSDPNEFIQASQRYVAQTQQRSDALWQQLAAKPRPLFIGTLPTMRPSLRLPTGLTSLFYRLTKRCLMVIKTKS